MYGLCNQQVTILRDEESLVFPNCAFQEKQVQKKDRTGTWQEGEFLLVVPGDRPIYPGDRVCSGGQIITIHTVIPYFQNGRICHREGRGG